MKKATLIKEGRFWKLNAPGFKKPMSISGNFGLTDDMDGKEVEYDNTGGPLKLIRYEGKEYKKGQAQPDSRKVSSERNQPHSKPYKQQFGRSHHPQNRSRPPARAPYNFIGLNDRIVKSNGNVDHSIYENLSGYIDLKVKAKTPLFIKGNDGNFFRVKDTPHIPGSSIRGLAAHLVQMVGYGKFQPFEDKNFYRRSTLVNDGKDVKAGFMRIEKGQFSIADARYTQIRHSREIHRDFQYVFNDDTCTFSVGSFGRRGRTIWAFKVYPGKGVPRKIPSKVIAGYEADSTRAENAVDIIQSLKRAQIVDKNKESIGDVSIPKHLGVPVFFRLDENGEIYSIGHAKYHRIPYQYTVKDFIPKVHREGASDLSETIFGSDEKASKVFFEDLKLLSDEKYELSDPARPKILSSPKPTSYQHYLEQPGGIQTNQRNLKNWGDDNAQIRGSKNYWHRKTSSNTQDPNTWIETGDITKSHPNPINPISKNAVFNGKIRFESLSPEELGALLFALDLPKECCHKLGMGKPLGLGSIRITPSLTLIDRKQRYQQLFDDQGAWESGESKEENIALFKDAFAKYIGEQSNQTEIDTAESYWANDSRMQELKIMLTLEQDMSGAKVDWNSRTRYMALPEFKKRPVLPKPSEVIRKGDEDLYKKP